MSEVRAERVAEANPDEDIRERWILHGVTHTRRHRPDGWPVCGGQIFAEWFDAEECEDDEVASPGSWECFCANCLECDINDRETIEECVRESPGYWQEQMS